MNCAEFRFYAELTDFLLLERRGMPIHYSFNDNPGIKDPIEALGVPHTEVDLIVVGGESQGFDYQLRNGDRVAVYPVFERLDISPIVKLRDKPLRRTAFILDVHLGKLARLLRLLGFNVLYRNDYKDAEIIDISLREHRIILTRDRRLLFHKRITHGHYIRSGNPSAQAQDVIAHFQLENAIQPFHRCMLCNDSIKPVAKDAVLAEVPPGTSRHYSEFYRCKGCGKIYWKGPHFPKLQQKLDSICR